MSFSLFRLEIIVGTYFTISQYRTNNILNEVPFSTRDTCNTILLLERWKFNRICQTESYSGKFEDREETFHILTKEYWRNKIHLRLFTSNLARFPRVCRNCRAYKAVTFARDTRAKYPPCIPWDQMFSLVSRSIRYRYKNSQRDSGAKLIAAHAGPYRRHFLIGGEGGGGGAHNRSWSRNERRVKRFAKSVMWFNDETSNVSQRGDSVFIAVVSRRWRCRTCASRASAAPTRVSLGCFASRVPAVMKVCRDQSRQWATRRNCVTLMGRTISRGSGALRALACRLLTPWPGIHVGIHASCLDRPK